MFACCEWVDGMPFLLLLNDCSRAFMLFTSAGTCLFVFIATHHFVPPTLCHQTKRRWKIFLRIHLLKRLLCYTLSVSKEVMMRGDNIASTQQQGSPSTCCAIILGGGGVGEWRRRRWRGCRSASPDKWVCFCWVCVRWAGGKPMKWPNERWD